MCKTNVSHEKMHLSQQQQQQQQEQEHQTHHDFIPSTDKTSSLSSNGSGRKIATVLPHSHLQNELRSHYTSDVDKFTGSEASCTSSTDSGVNMSDNETTTTAPPSPQPQSQQQQQLQQQKDPFSALKASPLSPPSPSSTSSTARITLKPFREQLHQNNNNSAIVSADNEANGFANNQPNNWSNSGVAGDGESDCATFDNKLRGENQLKNSSNAASNYRTSYQSNRNAIKIENGIKDNHSAASEVKGLSSTATASASQQQRQEQNKTFNDLPRAPSPAPSSIISSSSSDISPNPHPPSHYRHHHSSRSPAVSIRSIDSSIIDSDSDSDVSGEQEGVHENYVIKKLGTQVSYPPQHPDIPLINKGLTVVNQQMTSNGMGPPPPSPLEIVANLGERVGMAYSPALAASRPVANTPQVAISSSTDVTIGDKYFYEGPVTIQQFVIDSRDKRNDIAGKDNVTFLDDNGEPRKNGELQALTAFHSI